VSDYPRDLGGRLLVATPRITDPDFSRGVVIVLDHGEDGALGLVINRPLEVDVSDVLPAWQPVATVPGRLFRGGPVQVDSALGLVAVPAGGDEPIGVRRVVGSLGLVDLDAPPEVVATGVTGLRIFAGYAGWSGGQLESEIRRGAWYVVDAESTDPFSEEPTSLWRRVLRRQRGELAFVSTYPEELSLN
jgi:putative transcriptional regulator